MKYVHNFRDALHKHKAEPHHINGATPILRIFVQLIDQDMLEKDFYSSNTQK